MTTVKLAVYGTLKSFHTNHSILGDDAKVLARGVRLPNFSLYDLGWYPGVKRDADGPGVEVEIVEIPTHMLRVIDQYEGYNPDPDRVDYNSLFIREAEVLENGDKVLIYTYNGPMAREPKRIDSGRWEDAKTEAKHGANHHA
jgi:gamma-glutamylcyclotransferase (GGCT)/AIG2-like uncharacterized protein YtfP